MTNITIPALPDGTSTAPTALVESVEGGVSVKYSVPRLCTPGPLVPIFTVPNPTDAANAIVVAGSSNGIRMGTAGGIASIEGVSASGGGVYSQLTVAGNVVVFKTGVIGTIIERMQIDANGRVMVRALLNAANDAAAAGLGVPVDGLYRNGSVVMVRVV